jgi:hypothetical protein
MAPPAKDHLLARRARPRDCPARWLAAGALGLTVALSLGLTTGCKGKPPADPPAGSVLRLAFAQNMIPFDLAPGEQATRDVRLAGRERDNATLAIASTDGPATAALLPAEPEGPTTERLRPGVRLTFVAKEAGEGLGRVTVTTALAPPTAPKQLVLYYTWKVIRR